MATPDNLAIWNVLGRTDPKHTKQFKRAGGFSGTAIKPIWIVRNLTEQFGPVGKGWGIGKPVFETYAGHNGEVMVYCTVECWHTTPENSFYGVGGDKVVSYVKANEQYKRPERWENDDEAFKKAFTDAVGNAFKFLGVGADVHMGQFDDSKYVRDVAAEFADKGQGQSQTGAVSPAHITDAINLINAAATLPALQAQWTALDKELQREASVMAAKDARKAALADAPKPATTKELLDDEIPY